MRVYVRKGEKSFSIRLPLGVVKIIPAWLMNQVVSKYYNCESRAGEIDFAELKKAMRLLKQYKGMNIIEVKNSRGEEVVVRI